MVPGPVGGAGVPADVGLRVPPHRVRGVAALPRVVPPGQQPRALQPVVVRPPRLRGPGHARCAVSTSTGGASPSGAGPTKAARSPRGSPSTSLPGAPVGTRSAGSPSSGPASVSPAGAAGNGCPPDDVRGRAVLQHGPGPQCGRQGPHQVACRVSIGRAAAGCHRRAAEPRPGGRRWSGTSPPGPGRRPRGRRGRRGGHRGAGPRGRVRPARRRPAGSTGPGRDSAPGPRRPAGSPQRGRAGPRGLTAQAVAWPASEGPVDTRRIARDCCAGRWRSGGSPPVVGRDAIPAQSPRLSCRPGRRSRPLGQAPSSRVERGRPRRRRCRHPAGDEPPGCPPPVCRTSGAAVLSGAADGRDQVAGLPGRSSGSPGGGCREWSARGTGAGGDVSRRRRSVTWPRPEARP